MFTELATASLLWGKQKNQQKLKLLELQPYFEQCCVGKSLTDFNYLTWSCVFATSFSFQNIPEI